MEKRIEYGWKQGFRLELVSLVGLLVLGFISNPSSVYGSSYYNDSIADSLFESAGILDITLSGNMDDVLKDKSKDPQYFDLKLSFDDETLGRIMLPVEVKTRGNFRRLLGNCNYLPLMIKFDNVNNKGSIFGNQKRMKLVMPCKDENLVVKEWLLYKMYNIINPNSFRARLVRVKLRGKGKKKINNEVLGFFIEEEGQLADRLGYNPSAVSAQAAEIEIDNYLKMTIFQYLIANTDWSVKYKQNIKIIAKIENTYPIKIAIPYDFDHAGIVGASYAEPPVALGLTSTAIRLYRGYCIEDVNEYKGVINHYLKIESDLYKVILNCDILTEKKRSSMIKFVEQFYKVLQNPKRIKRALLYPCSPFGTGNVEVKGMKN